MPFFKMSKHYGEVKRCAECKGDSMRFFQEIESWICSNCNNKAREDFGQTVLPSNRELDEDDIGADNALSQEQRPLYFKSIKQGNTESNYEASVNFGPLSNADNDDTKYHGSAQDALLQDHIKFANERIRQSNIARQQRTQFAAGNNRDQDSQETLLDRHRSRRLRERDDRL